MTKEQLFDLCELLICSDPWPCLRKGGYERLSELADAAARKHGFEDWIEALHTYK